MAKKKRRHCKRVKNWCHCPMVPTGHLARQYHKKSYRVKRVSKNVQLVVACPKRKWNPRTKRCKVGMKLVSKRYRGSAARSHCR